MFKRSEKEQVSEQAAAAAAEPEQCYACGQEGKLNECGSCQSVVYCSAECQALDWRTGHKFECQQFIGQNGDTEEDRRLARRASIRRRRIVRSRPRRPGTGERRPEQETIEVLDPEDGRGRRRITYTTNLAPGDYEVYDVRFRIDRRRFRLRSSGKVITRNVMLVITYVQTRSFVDRRRALIVDYKPLVPPTVPTADEGGPACVEIECPPQFPSGTTCWRCIEAIAAPSTGEEGAAEESGSRRIVVRPVPPGPRPLPPVLPDEDDELPGPGPSPPPPQPPSGGGGGTIVIPVPVPRPRPRPPRPGTRPGGRRPPARRPSPPRPRPRPPRPETSEPEPRPPARRPSPRPTVPPTGPGDVRPRPPGPTPPPQPPGIVIRLPGISGDASESEEEAAAVAEPIEHNTSDAEHEEQEEEEIDPDDILAHLFATTSIKSQRGELNLSDQDILGLVDDL